jgi:DNA-binding NarL/FixJ family response regulator
MRVILVGSPRERAQLRAEANGSMAVVGEFATLDEARAADLGADAFVIANRVRETGEWPRRAAIDDGSYEEALTPREIEVLELLAEGLPNKGIARRLGISDQTVKFHVASISGKLGAANRTDAVRRAVRRGLISL